MRGSGARFTLVVVGAFFARSSAASPTAPSPAMDEAACDRAAEQSTRRADGSLDRDRAVRAYEAACDKGCAVACWDAGSLFDRGSPATRDYDKAFRYFERACARKSAIGCASLAFAYRMGRGTPRDFEKAKTYYRAACDLDFARGCGGMGDMLEHQVIGAPDSAAAARYYMRACDLGGGQGCSGIADLVLQGRGVTRDEARALGLYERGCGFNGAQACAAGGRLAEKLAANSTNNRAALQQKAEALYRQAVTLSKAACDDGDPDGDPNQCAVLGDAYREGKGVKQDLGEARRLYQIGCDGQMALGCNGLRALDQNKPAPLVAQAPSPTSSPSAPDEACKVVRCRPELTFRLTERDKTYVIQVPPAPYAGTEDVGLYPGDDFFIAADEKGDRLVNFRYVAPPGVPKNVIHVQFAQESRPNGSHEMILRIESFFARPLVYHALTHHPARPQREYAKTSTCPLLPKVRLIELWPNAVSFLKLTDFRFSDGKGPCAYY